MFEKEMEPIETELQEAGIEVKARVETGDPRTRIVEVAEEEDKTCRPSFSDPMVGAMSALCFLGPWQPTLLITRKGRSWSSKGIHRLQPPFPASVRERRLCRGRP